MPVWIEATRHFYGFPSDGRQAGVKVAWHRLGEVQDPDAPARPVDEADLAPLRACLARRLPDVLPDALSDRDLPLHQRALTSGSSSSRCPTSRACGW
jgi:hypothetical protein